MKSIVYPVFSNRHVISHISLFFLFRFSRALAFTTVDQSCTAISWGETHGLYWLIFCIQYTRLNSFLLFALSCALPFSFHSILPLFLHLSSPIFLSFSIQFSFCHSTPCLSPFLSSHSLLYFFLLFSFFFSFIFYFSSSLFLHMIFIVLLAQYLFTCVLSSWRDMGGTGYVDHRPGREQVSWKLLISQPNSLYIW